MDAEIKQKKVEQRGEMEGKTWMTAKHKEVQNRSKGRST